MPGKTFAVVFFALLALGLSALARAIYTNDTGVITCGFRIVFEAPVEIALHAPVFPLEELLRKQSLVAYISIHADKNLGGHYIILALHSYDLGMW